MWFKLFFALSVLFCGHFTEGAINICLNRTFSTRQEDVPGFVSTELSRSFRESGEVTVDHVNFNLVHEAIDAKGFFDNLTISGLSDHESSFFGSSDGISLEIIDMLFPNISLVGNYNLTGDIGDLFDIYGSGPFWLNFFDVHVRMPVRLIDLCIRIEFFLTVERVDSHFYDFMYDDELEEIFNAVLIDLIPEAIEVIGGEFKADLERAIQMQIDAFLDSLLPSPNSISKSLERFAYKRFIEKTV